VCRILDHLLRCPPHAGGTRVLAVEGRSGAGKTTLAARLAAALQADPDAGPDGVPVVHLDDLYPGWDGLEAGSRELVDGLLVPLARGLPAACRTWDWSASCPGPLRSVPPAPFVVVEGVGCGSRAARPYLSLLVWLEVPTPVRRARALARDGALYHPHWERWAAQEDAYLIAQDPAGAADVVLGRQDTPRSSL
jgi:hypothetical protein